MTDPTLPLPVRAAHNATAKRPTLLVSLSAAQLVDQVEDVIQRLANVLDVFPVVSLSDVNMRHVPHVLIQTLDAARQVIDSPAAKKRSHAQNDVEKNLHVVHVNLPRKGVTVFGSAKGVFLSVFRLGLYNASSSQGWSRTFNGILHCFNVLHF